MWLALLVACGGPETDSAVLDPNDTDAVGSAFGDLSGRYALKLVYAAEVQDPGPFTDNWEGQQLTSWFLADVALDGASLGWTETLCGLSSTAVFGTETTYPPAFVLANPVRARAGTVSSDVTGASVAVGPFTDVIGAALDAPEDALPTSGDDARVTDDDADGHPGVTVIVDQSILGTGEVYVAQRAITALAGTVVSSTRLEGLVTWSREKVVYGASAGWLEAGAVERVDPAPERSFFVLQEVSPTFDCDAILAAGDALFEG